MKILWGPKELQTIDLYLNSALSTNDSKYFPLENQDLVSLPHIPFSALLSQHSHWKPDLIILTMPHQRILPQYFERSEIPLVALCQDQDIKHPNFLSTASLFDGFIPTSISTQNFLKKHHLLSSHTCFCGIHPDFHFYDESSPQLYDVIYINNDHVIPHFELYESMTTPIYYFTKIEPSRLPNFINQSQLIIMDNPQLLSAHFEVIGCGKILFCHEDNQAIKNYFEEGKDFIYFNENNLQSLLHEYLNSEEKQASIRENALKKSENYIYSKLLPTILNELIDRGLNEQPKKRHSQIGLIEDSDPKIHYWTQIPHPLGLDKVRKLLEKREPKTFQDLQRLTFTYIQSGRHEAINVTFTQMLNVSLALLEPIDPPDLPILLNVAWIYHQLGNYEKAIASINMGLTVLENQTSVVDTTHLFFALEDHYTSFLKNNSYNQALKLTLIYFLAEAKTMMGQFQDSIQHYKEILALTSSEKTLHILAKTLLTNQQISEAIQTYDQLLTLNPVNIQVLAEYIFQLKTHNPSKGLELCKKTIHWLPRFVTGKIAIEAFYYLERQLNPPLDTSDEICRVFWEGPIFSHQSLANINRHLNLEMTKDSRFKTSVIYSEPHEYPPDTIISTANFSSPPDCFISHRWPPRFNAPQDGKWINIIPWEFGIVPREWVAPLNTQIDRLWVPSQFVAESFIRAGVNSEQISVIPNGVDTNIYKPEGKHLELKKAKTFRFLFVGGTIQRKGIDILLEAYCQAFSAEDDVTLIIKGFGQKGIYSTFSNQNSIQDIMTDPNLPDVLYLSDDFSDQEMASLYRSCHCYVHPYRGEGFGMPILEAMACGTPVIVPDAGPCLDFCDSDFAWFIPTLSRFESSRYVGGIGMSAYDPFWNEVDIPKLKETMQHLYKDSSPLKLAGQKAREKALQYDWTNIYQQASQELLKIKSKPSSMRQQSQTLNHILNQGVQSIQKKELNEGREYFKQALEIDPANITAWSNLNISYMLENKTKESLIALQQAIRYGLDISTSVNNLNHVYEANLKNQVAKLPIPFHVYWDRSYELLDPLPASSQYVKISDTSAQNSDLIISSNPALQSKQQVLRIVTAPAIINNPNDFCEIWFSQKEMKEHLLDQGVDEDRLFYLPLGIDFKRYKPSISPLILEESLNNYTFLSIFDWAIDDGWETLLKAYIQSFTPLDPVNLIFKPYGKPLEEIVEHVSEWLATEHIDEEAIPNITFIEEPLTHSNLPGLYTGSDTFVSVNQTGNGIWHLVGQACGNRVISCGHFSFLKNPYSQVVKAGDSEHLGWLLQQSTQLQSNSNSKAIREYLQPIHHAEHLQDKMTQRLGRRFLVDYLESTIDKI